MVLSHLPIRDLTRSLSVSKQWNSTILGSMDLRRTLFLEPAPAQEHLEYRLRYEVNTSRYPEKCRKPPVIIYEPSEDSKIVIEPHPVIASACDLESRAHQDIRSLSLKELKTVSPSTLLFQPPLKEISVCYGPVSVPGSAGATFGAIVEGFGKARVLAEAVLSYGLWPSCETYSELLDGTNDSISIVTWGALASNANCVKIAREALE
jgi:hypothetical protein